MIEKVVGLVNELQEIAEEKDFAIKIDCFGRKSVHVLEVADFFKNFQQYDIKNNDSPQLPFKAFVEVEGIQFYALLMQEEHEKFILKKEVS